MPASMNRSMSPSKTADGLPVSYSVRRSLTIWYGCSTYERIWSPHDPATSPRSASSVAASSARLRASSLDFRTAIAVALFCSCDRSFWQETTMPVGRWVSRTAESVVLTPWPPGPLERYTSTRSSSSGMSISSVCSTTGTTSTAAKLVCRRPWLSNGLIRTSRWVPDSMDRVPYAYGAFTVNVADLSPASSAYDVSYTSVGYPCRSAHRRYIRSSISAKSAASTPPAPDRIVTTASRESYGPDSSVRISSSSMALRSVPTSVPTSANDDSSDSASASSSSTCASSSRDRSRSSRFSSPCAYDSRDVTCCAFAWSSQRSGADAWRSS